MGHRTEGSVFPGRVKQFHSGDRMAEKQCKYCMAELMYWCSDEFEDVDKPVSAEDSDTGMAEAGRDIMQQESDRNQGAEKDCQLKPCCSQHFKEIIGPMDLYRDQAEMV